MSNKNKTINKEIEIIRQSCIKANPEIMELKFGCQIEVTDVLLLGMKGWLKKYPVITVLSKCSDPNVYLVLNFGGCGHLKTSEIYNCCEILGRPIRLSDVLLALENKFYNQSVILKGGVFEMKFWTEKGIKACINWDLKHDDLNLQSEETIKFLAELLK